MTRVATFRTDELIQSATATGTGYVEILRRQGFSMGTYRIPTGGADHQHPHDADEVYVVLSGTATLRADDTENPVGPGSIVSLDRHVPHSFHDLSDDLVVLVFFAPPELPETD